MPSSEYMREWRQTLSGRASLMAQKRRDKARRRALTALADRHVAEFDALFTMHLAEIEREEQDREGKVADPGGSV